MPPPLPPAKQTPLLHRLARRALGGLLIVGTVGLASCQAFFHSFPALLP